MLRWMTAGESHGQALTAILDGLPSGIEISTADVATALARRRSGVGRGARMSFEQDALRITAGLWRGRTLGSPLAIEIGNTEWPKWAEVMSVDPAPIPDTARGEALTRPRPGHADLPGMIKYGFADARAVLERSSARETAARVAVGSVAARFVEQALGVRLVCHVVGLGAVRLGLEAARPTPDDVATVEASPVRCFDPAVATLMEAEVEAVRAAGDTVGGVVEVLAYGLPVGLGSHVQADRRLDGRLAGALMSVQAVKGVEIGDGFALGRLRGSRAHDEIVPTPLRRLTNHAGGIEGGISNGEILTVRCAIKPIPTVPQALRTIDTATGQAALAHHQRSDTSAVVPAAVVAEAMTALVLAEATLEKFGGDSLDEVRRNRLAYLDAIAAGLR